MHFILRTIRKPWEKILGIIVSILGHFLINKSGIVEWSFCYHLPHNCPLSLWMPPKGPFIENVIYERTLNNKRCRLICNNLMGFIVIHWNKLENPFKGPSINHVNMKRGSPKVHVVLCRKIVFNNLKGLGECLKMFTWIMDALSYFSGIYKYIVWCAQKF